MKHIQALSIALQDFIDRISSIEGRTSRKNFLWVYAFFTVLIGTPINFLFTQYMTYYGVVSQLLMISLYIRRFQDSDRSKWAPLTCSVLTVIINVLNASGNINIAAGIGSYKWIYVALVIYVFVICCMPGSEGENDYGMPNELPTPQEA